MLRTRPEPELDRRIAALALPALGAIAAEPAYSLADTAIVGHLGRAQLGALAIATTALTMTAWVAIFLTTATTSAVAGLAAARAADRAGRSAGAAYLVAAAGGILVAAAVAVAAPWIAALLGARQEVLAGSVGYLRAAAVGIPFLYLSYAGNGHLVGLADARTPLRIAVSANVLNVALEVFLVYGVHLGLIGSAWGTVTAQGVAAAWYGAASRRAAVRPRRPGRAEVTALLRDGHQLSVRTIALGVVPLTTTAIAARLGPVALGGQQIAMRVWYLLALALDALAVPAQVYVSSSLGAGDPAGAHRVGQALPPARPARRDRARRRHRRPGLLGPRPVHRRPRRPARRHGGLAGGGADPADGRAGVRAGRPHPRYLGLRGHAPRDDPRHRGLRPGGGAGAGLPPAGPARDLGGPGALARRPRRPARAALAGRVQPASAAVIPLPPAPSAPLRRSGGGQSARAAGTSSGARCGSAAVARCGRSSAAATAAAAMTRPKAIQKASR